jgi:tetratricopeptide (TPR) repeat protein
LATVAARELLRAGETGRALEYARRVRTIIDQRGWFEGGSAAWLLPIEAVWRRGDIRGAAAALDSAKEEYAHGDRSARLELAVYLVTWNLSLGRTRAATDVADLIPDPNQRHFSRAIVAFHGNGGRSGLQREMASVVSSAANGGDSRVFYLVESGLIEQAQYEQDNAVGKDPGGMEVEKARIALARGDHRQALALLQRARPGATVTQAVYRFEYLADLYLRQGNRQQAIVTLQESLNFRSVPKLAFWWMRNELRLAELYHESGCASDARPLEAELARLLTAADPDFPLLVRLKALEAKALPADTAASCGGLQSGPKR